MREAHVFFLSPEGTPNYTPPVQKVVGRMFSTIARATAALRFPRAALVSAALVGAALVTATSATVLAAEPAEPGVADGDEETPVRGRPIPRDDRAGHVSVFGALGVVVPGGDLGGGVTLGQVANAGPGAEAGVALGLTRYSTIDVRGQFAKLGASRDCTTCTTQVFATGLGLTYHAAQALGFDPWVRFGVGYRALIVSGTLSDILRTAPEAGTFHGIDVASFSLGGDFFPTPWLGVGIFFGGDVGIDVAAPSSGVRGAVYGLFQAGLRIAIEPQRKPVSVASGPPRASTAFVQHSDFGPALYNRAAK